MKRIIAIAVLILSVTNLMGQEGKTIPKEYGYKVELGQQVPEFTMTTTDGKAVSTSDLKGKVVMLQFTASWCSVCRKEMPHIEEEIWLKHKDNPDFALYGIDMDEPLEKVSEFKKQIPVTYPMALDPKAAIFYTFAVQGAGVTRNVILDKTGKIVYMTRLYKPEEFNEMKQVIEQLLTTKN